MPSVSGTCYSLSGNIKRYEDEVSLSLVKGSHNLPSLRLTSLSDGSKKYTFNVDSNYNFLSKGAKNSNADLIFVTYYPDVNTNPCYFNFKKQSTNNIDIYIVNTGDTNITFLKPLWMVIKKGEEKKITTVLANNGGYSLEILVDLSDYITGLRGFKVVVRRNDDGTDIPLKNGDIMLNLPKYNKEYFVNNNERFMWNYISLNDSKLVEVGSMGTLDGFAYEIDVTKTTDGTRCILTDENMVDDNGNSIPSFTKMIYHSDFDLSWSSNFNYMISIYADVTSAT